jgi:D-alanyl-D-alanine carboxypeptidase (penicillin-binding protein 5/6)
MRLIIPKIAELIQNSEPMASANFAARSLPPPARSISAGGWALLLAFVFLGAPGVVQAQKKSSPKKIEPAAAAREAGDAEKPTAPESEPVAKSRTADSDNESPPAPEKPALSPEEERKNLLERIADNLSKRMRALAERERVASEREKTLSEREEALKERESLLEARENAINRREKLPPPQSWNGPPAPNIVGKFAAVIDGRTMQFYHEKAALEKTPVASTQKIVTALVICVENDLDEEVTVPEDVLRVEPTVVGLKPGQTYTRRELLRALLIKSGNDVAATLAITNAGSIEAFAEKMNRFARSLGMQNSHFINPHGLPAEGQYSCAHDMALAAFEAYQIPDIREIVRLKTCTFTFDDGTTRELYNTNSVLSSNEHCNGMKTGFTYAAGHCLISSGEKEGHDRIVVVIKSHKPYVWTDSDKLLNWSLDLKMVDSPANKLAGQP